MNGKAKNSFINRLWCVTWYTTLALLTLLLGSRVTYMRPTCVTLCPHSVFSWLWDNAKLILEFSSHKFDLLSIYVRLVFKAFVVNFNKKVSGNKIVPRKTWLIFGFIFISLVYMRHKMKTYTLEKRIIYVPDFNELCSKN